jgi:predicted TIM-barrel fold metal-dependent hydrolase
MRTIFFIHTYCLLWLFIGGCAITKSDLQNHKIDAHIHIYDTNREGSAVFLNPEKHAKIYAPHMPEDFAKVSQSTGVNYAVVVEASKRVEDNDWLIEVVNESDNMLALIGNLDPRHPDFKNDLERLAQHKKFRGIRIRPDSPLDISDPKVVEALGFLNKLDLVLELRERQGSTADIIALARKYPKMSIIMNHLAGGRLQNGRVVPDSWNERLNALSGEPNIYCKISMIYHLSGEDPAPVDINFYKPVIDPILDAFGPDRLIFGSNWTLSEMKGSYKDMIRMLDQYCREKQDLSSEQFYTKNALKAYGIDWAGIDMGDEE